MSNYKRHAQGQRFRKKEFGDMGLRAYKEQQQTIINALKLQAQQHKTARDEYLSGEIDVARKERENRNELKELEDAAYENRDLAREIRHKREIKNLEFEAKEKDKEAEFWSDFSTTYAQQYSKAATDIYGAIDQMVAKGGIEKDMASGAYEENIENSTILNKASEADMATYADKLYSDKTKSGHYKRTQHAELLDIKNRNTFAHNDIMGDKLIDDYARIELHTMQTLKERGIEVTKDNVADIMEGRALEIMFNSGMNPNSRGGKKFLGHVYKKAKALEDKKWKLHWGQEDYKNENIIGDKLKTYSKAPDTVFEYRAAINDMIKLYQKRYVVKDGQAALEEMDVKEAYIKVGEYLINNDIITNEKQLDEFNIPFPGQPITFDPDGTEKGRWWDRHKELESTFETKLVERRNDKTQKEKDKAKSEDATALNEVKSQVESGEIDLNNRDQLLQLENTHKTHEKTVEFIRNAKLFNPNLSENDGYLATQNLNKAYQNNDYFAWKDTMQYLGTTERKAFDKLTKQLDELNSNGGSHKEVKDLFEKYVKSDLKLNALNDAEDDSVESIINTMEQDFYFEYRKIADDEKLSGRAKVDLAIEKVKEKYKSNEGLYRKDGTGPNTKFPAMAGHRDPKTAMEVSEAKSLIKEFTWDNAWTQAKNKNKDWLNQDYIDRNLRNVINGNEVEPNAMIDYLYYSQPVRSEGMMSKTDIFNKILEGKGAKTKVPYGPLDHANFEAKMADITINGFDRMSDTNKARVQVYLEFVKANGGAMPYKPNAYTIEKDQIRLKYIESQYNPEELQ